MSTITDIYCHRQTDGMAQGHGVYLASIALHGKNQSVEKDGC